MMDFPKITLITPTYNQGDFIERTILSVLNQNYPNLEYIIIDGGSNDMTLEIIKKYETQLHYWNSEPDNGMYHALSKGFAKSSGEIMGWINSDDLLHPNSLFVIADVFKTQSKVNWLTGIPSSINEEDKIIGVGKLEKWSAVKFYSGNYKWIQQESTFWRRSLWDISGAFISTDYKFAGDFELWARFFLYDELYSLNTIVGAFRWRTSGQLSFSNADAYEMESNRIIDNYCSKLPIEVLRQIQKQKTYFNFWVKIPVFRRLFFQSDREFNMFPPPIVYDRTTNKFLLKQ